MNRFAHVKAMVVALTGLCGVSFLIAGVASCDLSTAPVPVFGKQPTNNDPPTLEFREPVADLTSSQGNNFVIRWADTDRDSNARISFSLVNVATNNDILLVQNIAENDNIGPDSFTANSALIPVGTYHLRGIIDDGVNVRQDVFAMTTGDVVPNRVEIVVVQPGEGPPTRPPSVIVTQPAFNLSVAQDDVVRVVVQPSELFPETTAYDPDSAATLYILLDLDQDPTNDDPADPDPEEIIVQFEQIIPAGVAGQMAFDIEIDLSEIPPRPEGQPYFIRATIDDRSNPRVHKYAVGTLNVVRLAAGFVDLAEVGKELGGARIYGFSPGANTGSTITNIGDFDADGVADFLIVARFGNPRNLGTVGEAYLIYGLDQIRFGGALSVNSIAESISGAIFEAPPVRPAAGGRVIPGVPRTDGISHASVVRDLTGDGRPEILIGLPHVFGAIETTDFDPADEDIDPAGVDEQVALTFVQGVITRTEGDGPTNTFNYTGVEDTTIASATPNSSLGSLSDLHWQNNGPQERSWGLIKFLDVLEDGLRGDQLQNIDIESIEAELIFQVFDTGGDADLFLALTDFNEQTTFATFAVNGGEPIPNADYLAGQDGDATLGTVSGAAAGVVNVDVSIVVQQLLNGLFAAEGDELRFILVPDDAQETGNNLTAVRSSEFGFLRPQLTITYQRNLRVGAEGCYPDDIVNNITTPGDENPQFDFYYYAGGMATQINSQNRDNEDIFGVNQDRLESTVVALELVGQESGHVLSGNGETTAGSITARADNASALGNLGSDDPEPGRISGVRYTAGWFDWIDNRALNQPARDGSFGSHVASIGDLNNDGFDEIIISAPRNERYYEDLFTTFGFQSTQWHSTLYTGSIVVIPGANYNTPLQRDRTDAGNSTSAKPTLDLFRRLPVGSCLPPTQRHDPLGPADAFEIFAEDMDDMLGGAESAGDFNQDGLDDILCGAPLNDQGSLEDSGAVYILYGRNVLGDFRLSNADDPILRTPMLRIRGLSSGDQIGWRQTTGLDVNGDRIDDVFISSPRTDFGGVSRSSCGGDLNGDGTISAADFDVLVFNGCVSSTGAEVFNGTSCKVFDYDNDGDLDDDDRGVLMCLLAGGDSCCANLVDNGFVAVIFGGVFTDGDRDLTQIATPDLPGTVFFGAAAGHRAGMDVSSAGDFNQDGFGDLLIVTPGESRVDSAGRERLGVVYLIFGGTHLHNTTWNLAQVGSADLPGIVFLSPYQKGWPNEAAPETASFIGDINRDGFGDIAIGNPKADFIDFSFPQGPDAPGTDAGVGRRRNAGDCYVIYGNNFGSNRATP